MLKGQKYFHSTSFSEKTNELIFLKSPKTPILGHFDHFWSLLMEGDFSRKTELHMGVKFQKVSEKINEPIPRKLLKKRMDGQKDRL